MAAVWKKLAYETDCILKSFFAAKGDLISASANDVPIILTKGTDGYVLSADINEASGLKWVAGAPAAAHDMLSVTHGDTTASAVARGDLIVGTGGTPKWDNLAITVPNATFFNVLGVLNTETEPAWKALFDATVPTTIAPSDSAAAGTAVAAARRDHVHAAPATFPATAHSLAGSATHTVAVGNGAMGGYQLTDLVVHTVANEAAVAAYATPVLGKMLWATSELSVWICTAIA